MVVFVSMCADFVSEWVTKVGHFGLAFIMHFLAHRKNIVDLYRFFMLFYPFNPFVVGSTPARPTRFILAKATETQRWLLSLWDWMLVCPVQVRW